MLLTIGSTSPQVIAFRSKTDSLTASQGQSSTWFLTRVMDLITMTLRPTFAYYVSQDIFKSLCKTFSETEL